MIEQSPTADSQREVSKTEPYRLSHRGRHYVLCMRVMEEDGTQKNVYYFKRVAAGDVSEDPEAVSLPDRYKVDTNGDYPKLVGK